MTVIKRTKQNSVEDLIEALREFIFQLEEQKENEAADDLRIAAGDLGRYTMGSDEFTTAISLIINAFEGEHELSAYTFRRKNADDGNWTTADQLYSISTKVLNLANRIKVR